MVMGRGVPEVTVGEWELCSPSPSICKIFFARVAGLVVNDLFKNGALCIEGFCITQSVCWLLCYQSHSLYDYFERDMFSCDF
jgi:hypothetical protein